MEITITFGWWLAPLAVTIVACLAAWILDRKPDHYRASIGDAIASMFVWVPAVFVSLIAWLIWALLT